MQLAEGRILLDQAPPAWGFTSKRFADFSYLWKEGDRVLISLIKTMRPGKGHFSHLVKAIEAAGFRVAVPVPVLGMPEILTRWGFVPHREWSEEAREYLDVWERKEGEAECSK